MVYPRSLSSYHDEYPCPLSECLSLSILTDILSIYHQSDRDKHLIYEIKSKIGNDYGNIDILNDFNHLLHHHSNHFESIYHSLQRTLSTQNECCLAECSLMIRNQRDRNRMTEHKQDLKALYFTEDIKEIATLQLLDRIHCFYFHSFDIGFKLMNRDKEHMISDTNADCSSAMAEMRAFVDSKRKNYKNIDTFHRLNNPECKFISHSKEYSYGWKFYYWEYAKDDHVHWQNATTPLFWFCGATKHETEQKENWYVSKKIQKLKRGAVG